MSNNSKYTKADFVQFMMSTIEHDSSNKENAKDYLVSQDLNVDLVVTEGMKRLKRLQLQIQAEKTKLEMQSTEVLKLKAIEWVDALLSKVDFSLPQFIKEQELTMSFRNVEELSKEDIKEILIKHFTLKFLDDNTNKNNEF